MLLEMQALVNIQLKKITSPFTKALREVYQCLSLAINTLHIINSSLQLKQNLIIYTRLLNIADSTTLQVNNEHKI